jgi:hypothetical protein
MITHYLKKFVEKFTNKSLFKIDELENLIRDANNDIEKIHYDN